VHALFAKKKVRVCTCGTTCCRYVLLMLIVVLLTGR